jgi:bacterioferritin-associated ferredoxin
VIVCICRDISDEDYATEDELRERLLQPDFNCGQCQIKYFVNDTVDSIVELGYN